MCPSAKTGDAEKSPASRFVQCTSPVRALKHVATPLSVTVYNSSLTTSTDGVSGAPLVADHVTCFSVESPVAPFGSIASSVARSNPVATNNNPSANTGRGTTEYPSPYPTRQISLPSCGL